MTSLTLTSGIPSSWLSITPGQSVTLQLSASTAPASLLIEGQIDGISPSSVATTNLTLGNEFTFETRGHNQIRITSLNVAATVNVSPFGLPGLVSSPLPFPATVSRRYLLGSPRVAFVGDSITANGNSGPAGTDPTDPTKAQTYGSGFGQWATLGMMLTQGRGLFAGIAAKAGATVVQVAGAGWTNDYVTNALKVNPDFVVMLDGANDLLQWPNGSTPTGTPTPSQWQVYVIQRAANLRLCLSKGVIPILCSVLPRNVLAGIPAPFVPTLNDFHRSLAAELNIPFIDLYQVMANPDGSQKFGFFGIDGTHPTPAGVWAMAKQLSITLDSLLAGTTRPMTAWNSADVIGSKASLMPTFGATLNTSGPVVTPGNYNAFIGASSFYTASYGIDDLNQRTFRMSSIMGGHNDGWGLQVGTGFAPGDLIEYAWRFRYTNPDPGFLLNLNYFYGPNTDASQLYPGFTFDSQGAWLYARVEQKVPKISNGWAVDASWIRPIVHIDTNGGTGSPAGISVEIGPISMVNLTKLGLAAW